MNNEIVILVADDDAGHSELIKRNLRNAGINNQIIAFKNGQETLDFLFQIEGEQQRKNHTPYLLVLDIRMPKIDGTEVLRKIKGHEALKKIPVIMLTTTDDPAEMSKCHELGCSQYITKPVDYQKFGEAIRSLGLFLSVIEVPPIST